MHCADDPSSARSYPAASEVKGSSSTTAKHSICTVAVYKECCASTTLHEVHSVCTTLMHEQCNAPAMQIHEAQYVLHVNKAQGQQVLPPLAAQHACACRTVQEREQDYSKARARIFGAQQSPDASMSPSHSPQIHDNAMRGMMNGSRPQNVAPMGGQGRGPPGRVDPSRKAVFRNREQDLQDPDYHRSNRYRYCF